MNLIKIGVITIPMSKSGNTPLSNLLTILRPLSHDIYLITGNEGYYFFKDDSSIHTYGVMHQSGKNIFTRILKYILMQLKLSYQLLKINKKVDVWIFYFGGDGLLFPMLTAKLIGKKIILQFPSSSAIAYKQTNKNLSRSLELVTDINCRLSDHIIISSKEIIKEWNLSPYEQKISAAYEFIVNTTKFNISHKFDERSTIVGYIGRFSAEKGVLNFIDAIPQILGSRPDIKFVFIGEGSLDNEIKKHIKNFSANSQITVSGWVDYDNLPAILNDLKLLVIPSYTETGPMIALEAMACGTPVLGTRVGQLSTILQDGYTGFVLENNGPECIAKNVLRALDFSTPDQMIENARKLVEKKYNYPVVSAEYSKILGQIIQN